MVVQLCLFACAAAALLFLSGFLFCAFAFRRLDLISRIVLAPGVTIAIATLLFLWAEVFSFQLGWPAPWIVLVLSLLAFVQRRPHLQSVRENWLGYVTLVLLFLLLLVVRFYSTRDWIVPPGVDSAQHAIIVQLLLDHHGLFQSWAPYSDSETFTYHFGFHAVTALFAWMTGTDASFAVLIMARVMGACAVLSVFGLRATLDAIRLGRRLRGRSLGSLRATSLFLRHPRAVAAPGRLHCFVERSGSVRVAAALSSTGKRAGRCFCFALLPSPALSSLNIRPDSSS